MKPVKTDFIALTISMTSICELYSEVRETWFQPGTNISVKNFKIRIPINWITGTKQSILNIYVVI